MIEFEKVSFAYAGGEPVLADLSLSISRNSFVSLVGRNGSGKSTIAALLNGLLIPQEGRVTVDGMQTNDRAHLWDIRRKVQLVFQNPDSQLIGGTVEEDIAFGLENLGIPRPEMGERIDWVLDFARLRPIRHRPVSQLSGGEKQRVALAGILAMKPQCVVLDEATSMLDDDSRSELLGLVRAINEDMGMTVLQITANLDDVLDSDRLLVLDGGRIELDGPPSRVFAASDRLEDLGLFPPEVVRLGQDLARVGIGVPLPALNLTDLVDAICRST